MKIPACILAIMAVLAVAPPAQAETEAEITVLAPAPRCALGQAERRAGPLRTRAEPEEAEALARLLPALQVCLGDAPAPQRIGGWITSGPVRRL